MREQVIGLAGRTEVAGAHRRLAAAWSSRDPSMAALHRASATDGPDEATADELDEARVAAARGPNGVTAALLTAAAEHSAEPGPRGRRLLAAARAASTDGDHATVRRLVGALEVLGLPASQRAEAAFLGGYSEMWAGDPSKASAMLLRAADTSRNDPLAPLLLVSAAVAASLAGDVRTALSIARRALEGDEGAGASIGTRAARAVEVYVSAVEIGGMTEVLPMTLCHRAALATRMGLWHRARALAETAEAAAAAGGAVTSLAYACAVLARVTAGQGDMDAAHAALDRARRTSQPTGAMEAHRRIDVAAGALAVAERRPAQALVPLLAAADASERAGVGDALHGPWALELLDVGSIAGAGPALERPSRSSQAARRGPAVPRSRPASLERAQPSRSRTILTPPGRCSERRRHSTGAGS